MSEEEMTEVFVSITVPAGTQKEEAARRASELLRAKKDAACGTFDAVDEIPVDDGTSFCGNLELPLSLYEDVEAGSGFLDLRGEGVRVEFETP